MCAASHIILFSGKGDNTMWLFVHSSLLKGILDWFVDEGNMTGCLTTRNYLGENENLVLVPSEAKSLLWYGTDQNECMQKHHIVENSLLDFRHFDD